MKLDRLKKLLPENVRPQLKDLWFDFQEFTAGGTMTQFLADLYERQFIDDKTYRLALMEAEDTITISGGDELFGGSEGEERLGLLGRGGMGEVFVARDHSLQRNVAVKSLYPNMMKRKDLVKRFFTEVQITAQLEHPGVPPVHAVRTDPVDGTPSYTMKLVRGRTLKQYMKDSIEQSDNPDEEHTLEARLDVFTRICDTLAYAHTRGVIHRDLKPDNVMVGAFGQIMVMDWGVARILESEDPVFETLHAPITNTQEREALTQMGETIGTPAYMSPEQAQGRNDELGPAADQYALGLILYELTVLRRARKYGKNTLLRVASGVPEDFTSGDKGKGLPREVAAIIRKATMASAFDRYEDVAELADDVRRFLRNEEVLVAPDGPIQRTTRWLSRNRSVALAAILALALLVVLVGTGTLLSGAAALAAQRASAAQREARLDAVSRVVDRQARAMSDSMYSYREQLRGIAHAAEHALTNPAEPIEFYDEAAFHARETAPPDMAMSRVYSQPISVDFPDISFGKGVVREDVLHTAHQLTRLAPILQRAQLASHSPDAPFADSAERHRLVSEVGVPIVWAYVATQDGLLVSAPGSGSLDDPDYDSRQMIWYQDVANKRQVKCDNDGIDESGLGMVVSCMAPLWSPDNRFLGVAAVDVTFDYFIEHLLEAPGLDAESLLVDSKGRIQIRSSQKGEARDATEYDLEAFEHSALLSTDESGYAEVDGTLLVWRPVGGVDWTYVVMGDADVLLSD